MWKRSSTNYEENMFPNSSFSDAKADFPFLGILNPPRKTYALYVQIIRVENALSFSYIDSLTSCLFILHRQPCSHSHPIPITIRIPNLLPTLIHILILILLFIPILIFISNLIPILIPNSILFTIMIPFLISISILLPILILIP